MEIVISILVGAVIPAVGWYIEHRRRVNEGKELFEIKRRVQAPFLNATRMVVRGVARIGSGTFEDLAQGDTIDLQLSNTGCHAIMATDDWPKGSGLSTLNGEIPCDDDHAVSLVYAFDP